MKRWRTDLAVSRYEEAISELKAQLSAWANEGRAVVLDALRYAATQSVTKGNTSIP